MQRQPITDPDDRVSIPTPIVQQMLQFANRHYRALTRQSDTLVHIKTFRAILAIYTKCCYFCRAETRVRCYMDDIPVDMTDGYSILLLAQKAKGDKRRTAADKSLLQLPIAAVPPLADLMEAFTVGRTSYCKQLDNGPDPATFWAVTRDETPHAWTAIHDDHRVDSRSVQRHRRVTPRNSNGHRIAYGRACVYRRTPHQDSRHSGGWSKTSDVIIGK
jgi:hypothetical protein